ncbi:CBO0543 family protein [Ammoniphilus sp. YIM 78166]|uniref:CBO0543 family protein n=1 Tax=Ammoniphilus sp. YIM 78166 TaxID=1644106 RepID=UPI00106FF0AD|nr:CBO0543 family protein [Ammoniphilus sp. YIM 78166]
MIWFPILTIAVNLVFIWFMPKRMTRKEIYTTWALLSMLSLTVDTLFGHSGEITLLHFQEEGLQISDLLFEIMLAPSFGIIFSNYMPEQLGAFIKYTVYWTAFSTLYEWVTVQIDFLIYQGWKLWYSTVIYVITFSFIRWHLYFLRTSK